MLLIIDNYDSFTYNLVQYFGELGSATKVVRNDAVSVAQIETMAPAAIVISPGPGTPDDAGICLDVVRSLGHKIPMLGVCMGHQVIGQAFGGKIVRADKVMHGKVSPVTHLDKGIFRHLANPLEATRYHSLVVDKTCVPEALEVTAWVEDEHGGIDAIMGFKHRQWPIESVQFHPESVLSLQGRDLLRNFLQSIHSLS